MARDDVLAVIDDEADRLLVDRRLAEAVAWRESRFDPRAQGDYVQGLPTSFGLYQLHRGGLLGSLTPEQAFDPRTNAHVALSHLHATELAHPGVTDPGVLAAISQAPADQSAYATAIDNHLRGASDPGAVPGTTGGDTIPVGVFSDAGGAATWAWDNTGGALLHVAGQGLGGAASAISAPFVAIYNLLLKVWVFFTSQSTWIRVGLALGGFALLFVALKLALGGGAMPVPVPV